MFLWKRFALIPLVVLLTLGFVTTTSSAAPILGVSPQASAVEAVHPVDANGFVTDGSPQMDDAHCVGVIFEQFMCMVARHPLLPDWIRGQALAHAASVGRPTTSCGAAVEQWRPEVAQYAWPVDTMLFIMCKESRGQPTIWNSQGSGACGLMQLLPCPPGGLDGVFNIRYAYYEKYVAGGLAPWGF